MDCRTARQLFDYARPRASELDADETEALQEHLEECPICRSLADGEWQLDDHLGRAMRAVAVPIDLRTKLTRWLRRDRHAWYRRCVWSPSAAAAAMVLALGLGWATWERMNAEPKDAMAVDLWSRSSHHYVENWFRETHGVLMTAPPQFDYAYQPQLGFAAYQGKPIPRLRFEHGDHHAWVYVLTDVDFDLTADPEPLAGYSAVLLLHPTKRHVGYVVYYTGEQLERFLENQGLHAA